MEKTTVVNNMDLFKKRLRELRGADSLQKTAEELGISRATLGFYENGERKPDIEILVRIAQYFHVSCDYLLGLTDVSSPNIDIRSISEKTGLTKEALQILTIHKQSATGVPCKLNNKERKQFSSLLLSTINGLLTRYNDLLDYMIYYLYAHFDYYTNFYNADKHTRIPISHLELIDSELGISFSDDYDYISKVFMLDIEQQLMFWRDSITAKRYHLDEE